MLNSEAPYDQCKLDQIFERLPELLSLVGKNLPVTRVPVELPSERQFLALLRGPLIEPKM
jgi:hypothetical protein